VRNGMAKPAVASEFLDLTDLRDPSAARRMADN